MMDEYNQEFSKYNSVQNEEHSNIPNNPKVEEFATIAKAKKVARVTSIVLTVIGISLILGGVISFTLLEKTTAKVEKFELTAEATQINYDINITESKNEDKLTLKIHNQFMSRTISLGVGEYIGAFSELTPGIEYKVSILEKNATVKSQTITTLYL